MHKNSLKITLCAAFCITSIVNAAPFQLNNTEVYVPERLGKLTLSHDDHGFCIVKNGTRHRVQRYDTDPLLRTTSEEQLRSFLRYGYLSVSQMSNKDYALHAHGRLPGGGPVTASILYWATKSLCYGTAVAAASTAVVATGGAAAGALTSVGVAVSTGGVGLGAVAVSGAIGATAGGSAAAVTATAATVTAAGSLAGAAAAVETASMGAFALGLWLPLP